MDGFVALLIILPHIFINSHRITSYPHQFPSYCLITLSTPIILAHILINSNLFPDYRIFFCYPTEAVPRQKNYSICNLPCWRQSFNSESIKETEKKAKNLGLARMRFCASKILLLIYSMYKTVLKRKVSLFVLSRNTMIPIDWHHHRHHRHPNCLLHPQPKVLILLKLYKHQI